MGEISPAPDNLLNRDFSATAPNEKWLTDITGFQISAGKVYPSPMIDCFDGMVVSWSIGTRPDAELVNTMLDAAIETVTASGDRPVVHSDRGGHYRWPGWLSGIADARLVRSMSRKGYSPDNAACEGFFGRLKPNCSTRVTGCPRPSRSSSRRWTPTSAGITKCGSRSRWAPAAPSSTVGISGSLLKPSKISAAPPAGRFLRSHGPTAARHAARHAAARRAPDGLDDQHGSSTGSATGVSPPTSFPPPRYDATTRGLSASWSPGPSNVISPSSKT